MKKLYNWHDVAKRTEIVYDRALKCANQSLLERLSRYDINSLHLIGLFGVSLRQLVHGNGFVFDRVCIMYYCEHLYVQNTKILKIVSQRVIIVGVLNWLFTDLVVPGTNATVIFF